MTRELSKIELFCDDGSVGRIQRALSQIKGVYDVKTVPVVNARAQANGKVKAVTGGGLHDMFVAHLVANNISEIGPKDAQDWLEKNGNARASASYMLRNALGARLLSRRGKSSATRYRVKP